MPSADSSSIKVLGSLRDKNRPPVPQTLSHDLKLPDLSAQYFGRLTLDQPLVFRYGLL